MKRRRISGLTALAALLLAAATLFCSALGEAQSALSVGSRGQEVMALKRRLYELNYYRKDEFTNAYTEDTAQRVRRFQQLNGLPETGEADADTLAALFAEGAVAAPRPTMPPLQTPGPLPQPDWPARDAEGFLAEGDEYFYENDAEGLWAYLSRELQIVITFRRDDAIPLEWFETEIRTRGEAAFETVETNPARPGRTFRYPHEIARENRFVLAFTDDFYAHRMDKGETVGIIIRNGQIYSEKTNKKRGTHLPNLDMLAQFPDGSLQVFACYEHTARELLDMGAVNVFSFGPYLIRDGKISDLVYGAHFRSIEPRQAWGMIAPGHYYLLTVQGRTQTSPGTVLQRLAEMMLEKGVTQALNLDGGNTMALVFRGRMLNKLATYQNKAFVRTVTSMIGIGHSEQTEQ